MLSENIIDLHYVAIAVAFHMYINAILVLRQLQSARIQDGYKRINKVHRQLSNQASRSRVSAVEP